jgi:hypothetical protein
MGRCSGERPERKAKREENKGEETNTEVPRKW